MGSGFDIVRKKIRQVFPARAEEEILEILKGYGSEGYETGQARIYLAILKLCEEKQLTDPSQYVKAARQDFRDVLAWAEYPHQMKFGPTKDPVKSASLKEQDEEQYQAWLKRE